MDDAARTVETGETPRPAEPDNGRGSTVETSTGSSRSEGTEPRPTHAQERSADPAEDDSAGEKPVGEPVGQPVGEPVGEQAGPDAAEVSEAPEDAGDAVPSEDVEDAEGSETAEESAEESAESEQPERPDDDGDSEAADAEESSETSESSAEETDGDGEADAKDDAKDDADDGAEAEAEAEPETEADSEAEAVPAAAEATAQLRVPAAARPAAEGDASGDADERGSAEGTEGAAGDATAQLAVPGRPRSSSGDVTAQLKAPAAASVPAPAPVAETEAPALPAATPVSSAGGAATAATVVLTKPKPEAKPQPAAATTAVTEAEVDSDADEDEDGEDEYARRRRLPAWVELPLMLAFGLLVVVVLHSYVAQPFVIPSGSMENTLQIGDRVLVNKLAYTFGDKPERGDVVVFDGTGVFTFDGKRDSGSSNPIGRAVEGVGSMFGFGNSGETDFVKRVIGIGGDHVVCCDAHGRITVNGVALEESGYLYPGDVPSKVPFDIRVPEGELWVMGDHRGNSADSREYMGKPGGGFVPEDRVVGRVDWIIWPVGRIGGIDRPSTFSQPGIGRQEPPAVPGRG
ncbi:signal peptidase I [Yinghuangia soli]|uniref:signal peptidase I n=1 Tax=Yinghuangia soli TaxID=2908204 RepID=UPI0027E37ABD|nr:signal peptidase I [Yinghuangia soli]